MSAPRQYLSHALPSCIARLAAGNTLRLLDGGNLLNLYGITREIRRLTWQVQDILENILLTRAFTCYQAATLLAEAAANRQALLVMDLLDTFYDENVALAERVKLLKTCTAHMQRLSISAPVLITNTIRPQGEPLFLEVLEEASGNHWRMEPLPEPTPLLRLL